MNVASQFADACQRAQALSAHEQSAVHVSAVVRIVKRKGQPEAPAIVSFTVSDWYSTDSTVRTYVNGVQFASYRE